MNDRRVGLVLAGGGARGAYEAGALSVLLPALEHRGERPRLLVGSSVGAINATYLAATAHWGSDAAVEGLLHRWRRLRLGMVIRPILLQQLPRLAARSVGSLLPLPVLGLTSLLDPSPLAKNLEQWIDWTALRSNLDDGRVEALAVAGTAVWTGRTVHIDHPVAARGWYIDGGTAGPRESRSGRAAQLRVLRTRVPRGTVHNGRRGRPAVAGSWRVGRRPLAARTAQGVHRVRRPRGLPSKRHRAPLTTNLSAQAPVLGGGDSRSLLVWPRSGRFCRTHDYGDRCAGPLSRDGFAVGSGKLITYPPWATN